MFELRPNFSDICLYSSVYPFCIFEVFSDIKHEHGIRYARACSSYECFILRAVRLSSKLLSRDMSWNVWNHPSGSFMVDMGSHQTLWSLPLPNVTWHSGTWPYTMTHSIDQTLHQFANLLPNWTLLPILTLLPNFGGFHRTMQRVRLANRGRLLLRTPGPVPFGTCICSNVETILSWTCHVYGPFEFRTPLYFAFDIWNKFLIPGNIFRYQNFADIINSIFYIIK